MNDKTTTDTAEDAECDGLVGRLFDAFDPPAEPYTELTDSEWSAIAHFAGLLLGETESAGCRGLLLTRFSAEITVVVDLCLEWNGFEKTVYDNGGQKH